MIVPVCTYMYLWQLCCASSLPVYTQQVCASYVRRMCVSLGCGGLPPPPPSHPSPCPIMHPVVYLLIFSCMSLSLPPTSFSSLLHPSTSSPVCSLSPYFVPLILQNHLLHPLSLSLTPTPVLLSFPMLGSTCEYALCLCVHVCVCASYAYAYMSCMLILCPS